MSAINPANHPDGLRLSDSELIRDEDSRVFSAMDSALRWTSLYLLDLLTATLGVVIVTGFFLNVILKPIETIVGHVRLFSVARGPYYVFPLVLALVAGYVSNVRFKGNHRYWIWVLPALYLAINLILWKSSGVLVSNHWQAAINHFFVGEPPTTPNKASRFLCTPQSRTPWVPFWRAREISSGNSVACSNSACSNSACSASRCHPERSEAKPNGVEGPHY